MGYWIELRCENRTKESAIGSPDLYPNHRCWSHTNDGPMQEASSTQASVLSAYRDLEKDALKLGWKKNRSGWICPFCRTALANQGKGDK